MQITRWVFSEFTFNLDTDCFPVSTTALQHVISMLNASGTQIVIGNLSSGSKVVAFLCRESNCFTVFQTSRNKMELFLHDV